MRRPSADAITANRAALRPTQVRRRYDKLAALMAVPLSQLGHLLVYFMRYGPANSLQESYGAHAYFPSVAKASAGLLGLLVLVAVVLIGLARLVGRRRIAGQRQVPAAALPELVAVLLPLQLAIFIGQETIELLATGRLTSLEDVPLLWGLAGQLPVALLAAIFLRWASIAVERAIDRLSFWLDLVAAPPTLTASVAAAPVPVVILAGADRSMAGRKRGPPRLSRTD